MITHPEKLLGWTIALTPIAISAAVAFIGYGQYQTSKNKLRLDLYNRRYAIYEKCVALLQAYWDWGKFLNGKKNDEFETKLDLRWHEFKSSLGEARFLFGEKSNVVKELKNFFDNLDILTQSFKLTRCPDTRNSDSARDIYSKANAIDKEDILTPLENALNEYLNFEKIGK